MKFKHINFLNILEWSFTFLVSGMMFVYGFGKYVQFGNGMDPELKGMKIMWDFYAYSKPFAIIIGLFEILGASLLIIPKTRIIGCLLLTSILINVILQDYFFGVFALSTAILLQILVFFILWLNRTAFILGLKSFMSNNARLKNNRSVEIFLIAITTLLFFFLFQFIKTLF